jgi:hypothetical protein
MIPKSRFDEVVQQRKAALAAIGDVVNELTEQIPEYQRDLIPNLPIAEKLKWLQASLKKGLFGSKQIDDALDTKRPNKQKQEDLSNMNPIELIEHGLKISKK